ncbi:6-hydroxycyclohex-1-ene-1-carbonyl-CoA dehydrogenase [Gemmatimonadota bacterium]
MTIRGWMMTGQGEPFEEGEIPFDSLPPGEALIEVAGCGVCHTDLSFLHFGVQTRAELPLVLGHEISGTVVEVGEGADTSLVGSPVLVPAVLPCGECDLCRSGNLRICRAQIMPGNDRHGGFASHVIVPARYLCPVSEETLAGHELWELAIVADAISTPFQSVRLSGLEEGGLAIFVGAGGIGIHGIQIASAVGAKVIALDIDDGKLDTASRHGADRVVNVSGLGVKEVKGAVKEAVGEIGAPHTLWKIFETSGTKAGQELAFALLGFGGNLAVVGFTMDRLELRLSNLMAFDATVRGNWGSDPTLYPEVLDWITSGRIAVKPFIEQYPLAEIISVFDMAHEAKLAKRAVMVPNP